MRDVRSGAGSPEQLQGQCWLWVLFQPLIPISWGIVSLWEAGLAAASLPGETHAAAASHGGNFLQTHPFEGQGELINCSEPFHGTDHGISPRVP